MPKRTKLIIYATSQKTSPEIFGLSLKNKYKRVSTSLFQKNNKNHYKTSASSNSIKKFNKLEKYDKNKYCMRYQN